jgi:hypothetical protein
MPKALALQASADLPGYVPPFRPLQILQIAKISPIALQAPKFKHTAFLTFVQSFFTRFSDFFCPAGKGRKANPKIKMSQ